MTGRAKAFFDDFNTRAAWMRRLVLFLLIAGGLWIGVTSSKLSSVDAKPLMQATATPTIPKVVISEFRTRGANADDEFIEVFNASDVSVNIGGWAIWKLTGSGNPAVVATIPPGEILQPGQHYLIANSVAILLVVPDGTYGSSIVDNTGLGLVVPFPQTGTPTTTVVIDSVGMIVNPYYGEGMPLPVLANDNTPRSYERTPGGVTGSCQDTNDNLSDFSLMTTPDPQNRTSIPVYCVQTATVTNTPTFTETPTVTATFTATLAPTPVPAMSVIINEVAWGGTVNSSDDEWIELYNPGSLNINLAGWHLISSDNSPDILLTGIIPASGYYLLERSDNTTISNIAADQIYTGDLSNNGETLRLYSPSGNLVDTANLDGGSWNGGTGSPGYNSMERRLGYTDGLFSWIGNTGTVLRNGLDASGNPINGTPKNANWANSVTPTATFIPTVTRTPTPAPPPTITRTPTLIMDFVILNELLPHATTDLNGDGKTDVGDEYIELINLSNITVSLKGWLLDDYDPSTRGYALPPVLMSPGQKLAFFASQTGQYLSDGGDSVVLIRPGGKPADIFTYPVLEQLGLAWCRIPDGLGTWFFGCIATPSQANIYQPNPLPTPTPLPQVGPVDSYFSACPLSNVDEGIQLAECDLPGLDIWNPAYWDAPDFETLPLYLENDKYPPVSLE